MRILYANHTGLISGAERSLLDLLSGLPPDVGRAVACPPGALAQVVRARGLPVSSLPEVSGGLRLHPRHSLQGITQTVRGGITLRKLARNYSTELIHANSARAGLMAAVAAQLGGPDFIVSVRDCLPRSVVARTVRTVVGRRARIVIANSDYTARNFGRMGSAVVTIHNPVDTSIFHPQRIPRLEARARLGLADSTPALGVVAQLAPWKGQDLAIRCAALLRPSWPALRLLIVGEAKFRSRATRYDNRAYAHGLHRLSEDLGLDGSVQFLGEREDVPDILRALDVLLVPSWQEPFGRSVIEAMAMETPVVATNIGGPSEIIRDGTDGILIPPDQPELWARMVHELLANPERRTQLGRHGRQRVTQNFTLSAHVARTLDIYRQVLSHQLN